MKYRISFLLTLLLLLASCQQELPPVAGGGTTGRGHISFNLAPMKSGNTNPLENKDFTTRAVLGDEDKVTRMDVVVFKESSGELLGLFSETSVKLNDFALFFTGCAGQTCNIYFIANLKGTPTNITNEAAFKKSDCGLATISQTNFTTGIPMLGSLLNYTIPADGIIKNAPVTLNRLLARVDIVYTNAVPAQFTATSLQVCNVPNITPYYSDVITAPAAYYTPAMPVSDLTAEANPPNSGITYTYYIPANRKGNGSSKNTDPRLKLGKDTTTPNPTYVKITGSSGFYTFYLGGDDCNNYDVLANTKYTVYASIKGVSNSDSRVTMVQPESNCYIVAPGRSILIPVSRAVTGYAAAGGTDFSTGTAITTGVLWSDVAVTPNVTPSVMLDNTKIMVQASNTEGNSVIYAMMGSTIVWSWHIWVTNYNPVVPENTGTNTATYKNNNILWMDRNLGATTATSNALSTKGLMYQWGRKDPFPGSTTIDGSSQRTDLSSSVGFNKTTYTNINVSSNLLNSIKNPLTFYTIRQQPYDWYTNTATNQKNDLWYDGTSAKTIYDPCPVGWCVPIQIGSTFPWTGFPAQGISNFGAIWGGSFYPASGLLDCDYGNFMGVGTDGNYWLGSVAMGNTSSTMVKITSMSTGTAGCVRASAISVRCVKRP